VETEAISFYCDLKLENFVRPSWQKSKKGWSRVTGRTELKYERERESERERERDGSFNEAVLL